MKRFRNGRIVLHACLMAGLLLAGTLTLAQEAAAPGASTPGASTPGELVARYPSGSIQSEATANRALLEIEQQRNALDQKYAAEERECYAKFFATPCLDAAKERRRAAKAEIRKVEVEADTYLRANRVVQRDEKLAEKRANEAANPPKPLADLAVKPAPQSDADKEKENRQRIAEHEAKRKERQQDQINDAPNHAQAAVAYQKKVQDAQARQRDVAAKKAEKEKQAAAKAANAAAAQSATSSSANAAPPAPVSAPGAKP
ncbi:MAG: hypothetical protein P4L91_15210 [Burkholderiaceae bacterium]|nr:hypothetical protein [Burkholderiaceae bacterium]